jgi:hypothetical protein
MAQSQARMGVAFAAKEVSRARAPNYHSLLQIAVYPLFSTVYRKMLALGLAMGQTIEVERLIGRTGCLWYGFKPQRWARGQSFGLGSND